MSNLLVGLEQEAEASVIKAADIAAAKALGYDINAMLANGEDVSSVLERLPTSPTQRNLEAHRVAHEAGRCSCENLKEVRK